MAATFKDYDVLVVGGGHAGVEAALAAKRLSVRVALITLRRDKIGWMSCNPAIGGIGKGHLVREIDALGGEMARNTDATAIQFRRLNTRKGPAVRATRAQCDRVRYAQRLQRVVTSRVEVIEGEVKGIIVKARRVHGVVLGDGQEVYGRAVVLTTGTFMNGLLHFGEQKVKGGRMGEPPSEGLSDALRELGFSVGRLKTGTPPRLLASSLDYDEMTLQPDEPEAGPFSLWGVEERLERRPCYVTHTTQETHEIIRKNLHRSPLFSGEIKGRGPRYCPSIEDKVVRFAHHERHRVFIEPEGLDSPEVYPNGLSTSLPLDVQIAYVRTIPGLRRAEITKPGYAVEYDFVDPREVAPYLETHRISGLFLAGQILGTTGYEEAGALGLLAGANAALKVLGQRPLVLTRADAYLGVMCDDLTTRGVTEPYRMFTSRAEFRLALREDNAHDRLCPIAIRLGLLEEREARVFEGRRRRLEEATRLLKTVRVRPSDERAAGLGTKVPVEGLTLEECLKRPEVRFESLLPFDSGGVLEALSREEREALTVRIRFEGYLSYAEKDIERFRKFEDLEIPEDLDFSKVPGLSLEVRERLSLVRPKTLGFASRLEGVTPAALAALLVAIKGRGLLAS